MWSEAEREGLSRCLLKFGTVRWRRAFEALREEQPLLQHAAGDALDVCCHLLFQWLTHVTPSSAAEQREVEADRAYGAGQCAWLLNEARGGHGGAPLDEHVIAGGLLRRRAVDLAWSVPARTEIHGSQKISQTQSHRRAYH